MGTSRGQRPPAPDPAPTSQPFDRRPETRGDQRRDALLRALDELLREKDLESVTIADITSRAGVTRSGFYFYFENKIACIAALGADIYLAAVAASDHLSDVGRPPAERIQAMISDLVTARREHHHLYRASLEARGRAGAIRELWDGYLESFLGPVTRFIEAERAAGRAPAGPAGPVLAELLLELSDRTLENLSAAGGEAEDRRVAALATIWLRSIYATGDDAP